MLAFVNTVFQEKIQMSDKPNKYVAGIIYYVEKQKPVAFSCVSVPLRI